VARVAIRAERPADWEAIGVVTRAAFGKEREARMVEAIRSSDGFVPELSLVAEDQGRILGHLMLSYVELEDAPRRVLELGLLGTSRPCRPVSDWAAEPSALFEPASHAGSAKCALAHSTGPFWPE
jgi:hypothetical protein